MLERRVAAEQKLGGDIGEREREREEEEDAGDGDEHHAHPVVLGVPLARARLRPDTLRERRLQLVSHPTRLDDASDDEHVQRDDDEERHERVDARVQPRPHVVDEEPVAVGAGALPHRLVLVRQRADADRPEEVSVRGDQREQHARQGAHRLGAVTQRRRAQRVAHGHVPLDRHDHHQPAGVVAESVADHADRLADPVVRVAQVAAHQLAHPEAQQAGVQHHRVGDRQHRQVHVGGVLAHRAARQDDER